MRRAGLAGAGVASDLASLARPAGAQAAPGKPRPNILFILTDDRPPHNLLRQSQRGEMQRQKTRRTHPRVQPRHELRVYYRRRVPADCSWPDEYDDSYLFADLVCNRIFELRPDGAGFDRTVFDHEGGWGPIAMEFGPSATKDLCYTTFGGGQVRRIAHNPGP